MDLKKQQALVLLIVGVCVGVAFTYSYMQGLVQSAFQAGYGQGYSQASTYLKSVTTPAELEIVASDTIFDFSANVRADGSASAGSSTILISIANLESGSPINVAVSTINPLSGKSGIPKALSNEYFNVYAIGPYKKYLFYNGEHKGALQVYIDKDSVVELVIGAEILDAPVDTFVDGQSYKLTLYLIQQNNYVESFDLTVLT